MVQELGHARDAAHGPEHRGLAVHGALLLGDLEYGGSFYKFVFSGSRAAAPIVVELTSSESSKLIFEVSTSSITSGRGEGRGRPPPLRTKDERVNSGAEPGLLAT